MSKDLVRPRPIISIIGDRFMLPSMFEKAIREKCGDAAEIRSHEMPWPDEPMEHGYAEPGMEGLKEYQGTADEVVAHMDGARSPSPISRPSPPECSNGCLIEAHCRLSWGPGEHRHGRGAQPEDSRRQYPGTECIRSRRIHHRRHPCRNSAYYEGHESLRRGEWRGDLYRAISPARNCRK